MFRWEGDRVRISVSGGGQPKWRADGREDDHAPSSDGQRFLVKVPVEQDQKPVLNVVTNWTSLLR